jgi:predicted 3-demethylubiquinone-9 3-methyltransferase (glyoxalase superfamily)
MQKITPFLWFNNDAEEAVRFYVSVFKNSKINQISRYGKAGPGPEGSVMTISFELDGLNMTALNGGAVFKFNESISLVVHCDSQKEVDYYWEKLLEGGQESQCGWLKDKYGLSWQIVPDELLKMIDDKDPARSAAVMNAMLKMVKLDLNVLKKAYESV